MDVHDKLDELSALVEGSRAMPMSASCVLNRAQVLDLLDEARADADRIIAEAREEQHRLVGEHEVFRAAEAEAEAVRAAAVAEADRMRRETDDYVDAKLANFEVALHKTLTAVQRGRDKIRGRHAFEELGEHPDGPFPG